MCPCEFLFFSAALISLINEGCCSPCLARRRKKLSWKLNICQCGQRVNNFVRPVVGQCACVCACSKFFLKTQCSRVVGKDGLVGYKLSTSVQSLVHCLLLPFVRRKHFSICSNTSFHAAYHHFTKNLYRLQKYCSIESCKEETHAIYYT